MARKRDSQATAWLVLGVLALPAAMIALRETGLLWTVAMPQLVSAVVLLVAAAPTVGYAVRRGRYAWAAPVAAAVIAIGASAAIVDKYEPPGSAMRDVFAQTPIPSWPGAGPVRTFDECRYSTFLCLSSFPSGTLVATEVTTDDIQRTCLQIADKLVAEGWTDRHQDSHTDWCKVTLRRPAPLGRVYIIEVRIFPDDISRPTVDPAHTPEPGRVGGSLHAERPADIAR